MIATLIAAAVLATTGEPFRLANDVRGCDAGSTVSWCEKRAAIGKPLTPIILDEYVNKARENMVFTPSETNRETWRSFYDDARRGRTWRGDCDNLVWTVLEWLERDGYDIRETWRLAVNVKGGAGPDHLVAVARIDGVDYVFADGTRYGAYPLAKARWTALFAAKSDTVYWLNVAPVRVAQR